MFLKRYNLDWFKKLTIVASNDINEDILHSLNSQVTPATNYNIEIKTLFLSNLYIIKGHSIDQFGIGTHLVTCQKQPALGCVFKVKFYTKMKQIKKKLI